MENLLLPSTIKFEETANKNEGRVVIEPCYHGYGTTLGNSLRRVLLSSLPGAAVTAVKIKGAPHEFSTIENIKEDVVEIILNLKQLRLRCFSNEEVRLSLSARGEKEVTAGDIAAIADVEIVNPDLHLASLTNKNAKLEMEIFVSRGRGYVAVEERGEKKSELGVIAIDSIFTPVLNVGYKVDFIRVGEITNFERLTLTIETDGTMTPQESLNQSTTILLDHFNLIHQSSAASEEKAEAVSATEVMEVAEENEEVKEEAKKEKKPAKRGRPKKTAKA